MAACSECLRLREETSAAFSEYLLRKDDLAMARKNDKSFVAKRRALEKAEGQLRESRKREDQHKEEVHGSDCITTHVVSIEQKLERLRECVELADAEGVQEAVFDLSPIRNDWRKIPDEVVEGLLSLLRSDDMYGSSVAGHVMNYFEFEAPRLSPRQKSLCIGFLNAHGDQFTDVLSQQVVAELREGNYLR